MGSIFHGYDVRGIYPTEIDEDVTYKIARATVQLLKAKQAIVGRDCRNSSLALKKSLIYGLTDQGCDVVDIGLCNTPMTYYAAEKMNALMITASHNPPEYNGIKITKKGVEQVGQHNGLKEIEKMAQACHFQEPKKRGKVSTKDILSGYVKAVRKIIGGRYAPIKVLIDCGNGMAGHVVPALLKGLSIKHKLLFGKIDFNFPNHIPNPAVPENTADLEREVVRGKYDLGVAYDADCDRVYFVDEKGKRVRCEHILLLFAQNAMKKGQGVVYTVNSSKIIREKIAEMGGRAHPSQIGHSVIPPMMRKHNALFGAEVTGHFYFKNFHYSDSGDVAALMMMSILSQSGKKMSQLITPFQKYATSEEINFKVADKDAVMKKVEGAYKGKKIERIDGISIDAGDYWFNLRLSKTENLVRLNIEAVSQAKLRQSIEWLSRIIQG